MDHGRDALSNALPDSTDNVSDPPDAQSNAVSNYSIAHTTADDTYQFEMREQLILERRECTMCSNKSVWRRGVRVASTDDSQ